MKFNFCFKNTYFIWFIIFLFIISCKQDQKSVQTVKKTSNTNEQKIVVGANQTALYFNELRFKNFAVVANQTSVIQVKHKYSVNKYTTGVKEFEYHLIDYLKQQFSKNIKKVFAPEHGFRGKADAGEHLKNRIDLKTKLPIISLYGKNKKPSKEQLKGIDVVLFDIQDVGVRFYTYISTLHYVMEACAENNIKLIILDRPNPNAHYIDGPVLEKAHQSFVGMHVVPLVYGMTIGEYGQMINGENWLPNNLHCDLTVIPLKNYKHQTQYNLPIKPSPNLPNAKAVNLYPSLAFFEGTNVSCGRGTEMQFQIFGSPFLPKNDFNFQFIPKSNFGAKYPKHKGINCNGLDLKNSDDLNFIQLKWLVDSYNKTKSKANFFNSFFTKLAGTKKLQKQIENGISIKEIRKSWIGDLEKFKQIRKQYLIY